MPPWTRTGHWVATLLACALHANLSFVYFIVATHTILQSNIDDNPERKAAIKDANRIEAQTTPTVCIEALHCHCDLCTDMIQTRRSAKTFELQIISTKKPIAISGAVMISLTSIMIVSDCGVLCRKQMQSHACCVHVVVCAACHVAHACAECECAVVFPPQGPMLIQCVLQRTVQKSGCENRKRAHQDSMQ